METAEGGSVIIIFLPDAHVFIQCTAAHTQNVCHMLTTGTVTPHQGPACLYRCMTHVRDKDRHLHAVTYTVHFKSINVLICKPSQALCFPVTILNTHTHTCVCVYLYTQLDKFPVYTKYWHRCHGNLGGFSLREVVVLWAHKSREETHCPPRNLSKQTFFVRSSKPVLSTHSQTPEVLIPWRVKVRDNNLCLIMSHHTPDQV